MNISLSQSEVKLFIELLKKELNQADGHYKMMLENIIERLEIRMSE